MCKRRRLRDVLTLPRDDRETRRADQHIQAESARIRQSWSEREHRRRAGLTPEPEPVEFPEMDGRLLGEF
jgi:hypothetical protein